MIRWKIFGYGYRKNEKGKLKVLCIIEAENFDEAIRKARGIYGSLYVTGAQPE